MLSHASILEFARSPAMAALKVFRTPIGFHDAYVAAPSQKAALQAWGADANLFARGAAERVTDPDLMKEPLAQPGIVIKRRRASAAEHFASLSAGEDAAPSPARRRSPRSRSPVKAKPPPAPKPRPSRAALDAAAQALAREQTRAEAELATLEEEQARIAARIHTMRERQAKATARLERRVDAERRKYEAALDRWRAS